MAALVAGGRLSGSVLPYEVDLAARIARPRSTTTAAVMNSRRRPSRAGLNVGFASDEATSAPHQEGGADLAVEGKTAHTTCSVCRCYRNQQQRFNIASVGRRSMKHFRRANTPPPPIPIK